MKIKIRILSSGIMLIGLGLVLFGWLTCWRETVQVCGNTCIAVGVLVGIASYFIKDGYSK